MPNFTPINRHIVMVSPSSLEPAAAQRSVLLVCTSAAPAYHADVDRLLENLRSGLDATVQLMHINETTHPEVVRSFGFVVLPAFVLLRQGLELWRYAGPIDSPELFYQLNCQVQ